MATAALDENGVPSLVAALNTDGTTPIRITANPTNHGLSISDNISDNINGSDNGRTVAYRDENSKPVLLAVSSVDGVTPVEVYANSSGELLVDST